MPALSKKGNSRHELGVEFFGQIPGRVPSNFGAGPRPFFLYIIIFGFHRPDRGSHAAACISLSRGWPFPQRERKEAELPVALRSPRFLDSGCKT